MKVLITGFDPFGGETINPAFEALKSLPDEILDYHIITLEIPTVFDKSIRVLSEAISKHQPEIVVCVGQAGGRFGITPEYVAININEARIEDNDGNQPSDEAIESNGPNAYFTNLPVKAIVKKLIDQSIPSSLSYTAGTFVCNHVFYGLMHLITTHTPTIRGGFIHVPYLPEQVLDKRNQPYMTKDMITQGLTLAIEAIIENQTDISLVTGNEH